MHDVIYWACLNFAVLYTAEPIYSYMIGKDAGHNQVLISKNDRL